MKLSADVKSLATRYNVNRKMDEEYKDESEKIMLVNPKQYEEKEKRYTLEQLNNSLKIYKDELKEEDEILTRKEKRFDKSSNIFRDRLKSQQELMSLFKKQKLKLVGDYDIKVIFCLSFMF